MVTLLFTSVIIIGFLAVALYFWQKPAKINYQASLPPLPYQEGRRGLFSEAETTTSATPDRTADEAETQRNSLLEMARSGDRGALPEAHVLRNTEFYNEILNLLVASLDSDAALLSLVSYVVRSELPVNKNLAQAVLDSWKAAPDRNSTAKTLHLAALADDAELYRGAVETALRYVKAGKLPDVTRLELQALFDGEYWVLSARTRSSGAGFILKRTLANARRELGNTADINQ